MTQSADIFVRANDGIWETTPDGNKRRIVVYTALALTGFAVYGPIALIGIQALSFVPKNAAWVS